ncbi:hypothetical protein OV203_47965 [Nannocystis sp. ILAH1]|uniref:hypothetical protein n=1 Tax=unclassified Nannocystis TaxID=2627009 RepID=UPI00226E4948|nr:MULTISPECIES: hypothetical protein [unclassified Nannocystis]MCY0994957.1 hypothetical protein [Nannocystis sp. ILAH1]MCY1065213.1 hypothetical protein [Nannocystis sp. RBIL2]
MSPTEDEVKAAIAALASPGLRARDDASATLELGGWAVAMQLLQASRELRRTAKARALFTFVAITYAEQIRRVRGAPRPLQLRLKGNAGEVSAALQPLVGLDLRVDPELVDIPVALECTCASTMAALDLLASAIGARWQQDEFGAVDGWRRPPRCAVRVTTWRNFRSRSPTSSRVPGGSSAYTSSSTRCSPRPTRSCASTSCAPARL